MVSPKQPSGDKIGNYHINCVMTMSNKHHYDTDERHTERSPVQNYELLRRI